MTKSKPAPKGPKTDMPLPTENTDGLEKLAPNGGKKGK